MKGKSTIESWHSHNLKATFRGQLIYFLVYEYACAHLCVHLPAVTKVFQFA